MSSTKSPINLLLAALIVLAGCSHDKTDGGTIVARVGSHKLYAADLKGMFAGLNADDSAQMASRYIDQWIEQMALVAVAETQVDDDFDRQMEDYRNSLVVYAYEQQQIGQRLDTVVSENDITDYYNKHQSDFILAHDIVKAVYAKIPSNDNNLKKVRYTLYNKTFAADQIEDFRSLVSQYASQCRFDADSWISLNDLTYNVPLHKTHETASLMKTHYKYFADGSTAYVVRLLDVRHAGQPSPLEYVANDIAALIVNQRRVQEVKKWRSETVKKAYDDGIVEKR